MAYTGGRVIGLTSSTNAARVLAGEGMSETYNIAQFLGKIEGSTQTRGHVPVGRGDVLVVDEASQVSTMDLAAIQVVASQTGARIILCGDLAQLSAVEAGGIVREISKRQGYWELHEVRRFTQPWEAKASLRLRAGDIKVWTQYQTYGRIRGGDQEATYKKAVAAVADRLRAREGRAPAGGQQRRGG